MPARAPGAGLRRHVEPLEERPQLVAHGAPADEDDAGAAEAREDLRRKRGVVHRAQHPRPGVVRALIPLEADTFEELAVANDGSMIFVDRLAEPRVRIVSPDGVLVREDALLRRGLDEGGAVTAVIADGEGVWAELEHTRSLRILAGERLDEDTRGLSVPGRPVGGRGLFAGARLLAPPGQGSALEVWLTDPRAELVVADATVRFADPLFRIVTVAQDARGRVVVVGHTMVEGERDGEPVVVREALEVVLLTEDLVEERCFKTRPTTMAHEQRTEIALGPDGSIFQMRFDERGVEVLRWTR